MGKMGHTKDELVLATRKAMLETKFNPPMDAPIVGGVPRGTAKDYWRLYRMSYETDGGRVWMDHIPPAFILGSIPEFTRQFYRSSKARRVVGFAALLGGDGEPYVTPCIFCDQRSVLADPGTLGEVPTVEFHRKVLDLLWEGVVYVWFGICGECGHYLWACPMLDRIEAESRWLAEDNRRRRDQERMRGVQEMQKNQDPRHYSELLDLLAKQRGQQMQNIRLGELIDPSIIVGLDEITRVL